MPSIGRSEEARLGIGGQARLAVGQDREMMSYRLRASDYQWPISDNPLRVFASMAEALLPKRLTSPRDSPPNPQPGYCALEALFWPMSRSGRTEPALPLLRLRRDIGGGNGHLPNTSPSLVFHTIVPKRALVSSGPQQFRERDPRAVQ